MRNLLLLVLLSLIAAHSSAQDNCSNALSLCNGQTTTRSTTGATPSPLTDPILHCGDNIIHNNVWFQFTAISNGSVTVSVTNINNNPGLAMEVYTGSCSSLVTTGICTTGSSATGGAMTANIPVIAGTTYYVMVDGENGNQEAFTIRANSQVITGLPVPGIDPLPSSGCAPFTTTLQNTSVLQGGTNTTYSWRIDNGSYLTGTGLDTTVDFNFVGTHTVELQVCNLECGCVSITKFIQAQDLVSSISYSPSSACLGSPITFDGLASINPDPPFTDPDVTGWQWDFGDPGSGGSNTATGQSVTHQFVGPQTTFNVQLIVFGLCGPDTVTQLINLNPKPLLQVTTPITICEGANATLSSLAQGTTPPYTYAWTGSNGAIQCPACSSTVVSGLVQGGPYTFGVQVTDASGCTADTTVTVSVNPLPVLNIADTLRACLGSTVMLMPSVITGNGPFNFQWTPSTGLNDPTTQNPNLNVSGDASYCVVATDAAGCSSAPACIFIDTPTPPTISASVPTVCASDPNPQNVFEVFGASPGSSITWANSVDYNLISFSPFDSTYIRVDFPQGIAGTYSFTAIVEDITTGCIDTLPISFTLSNLNSLVVNAPAPVCEGTSATLTASGSSTYAWTSSPSYPFTDPSLATQNVTPDTTTLFIVTGTTGNCVTTDTVVLEVNPIPVIDPIAPWQICAGSSVTISATLSAGTAPLSFSWSPTAGVSDSTAQNPTITPPSATTYCVTATDAIGCSSQPQCVTIDFYPPPTITPAVNTVCATDPTPQNTFIVNGTTAGSTISWATSLDYPLIVASDVDSTFIIVNFPPNQPGTYDFTAIVEDIGTGCIDTVTSSFTLSNPTTITVTGSDTVCAGSTVNLIASGGTSYSWGASPAVTFTDPTLASQSLVLDATTSFFVGGGPGECSLTDTFLVFVNPRPTADVIPPPPSCGCDTFLLSGGSNAAAPTFQWLSSNGLPLTNPNGTSTLGYGCNGDAFTLLITDQLTGCTNDSTVIATARNSPNAVASVSPTLICPGTPTLITLNGNGSETDSTTISWTSSDLGISISDPSSLNTEATVSNVTIFTITVTDTYGCDSTASDTVFIQPPPGIAASLPFLCVTDPLLQSTISIAGTGSGSSFVWSNIPPCVTPSNPSGASATFDFSTCGVGSYSFDILITDPTTGCVTDTNCTVNVIAGVVLSFSSDTITVCEGDIATASVSGANSYLWNDGTSNDTIQWSGLTAAGSPYSFSVIGTVGSCSNSDSVVVIVNPINSLGPIQGPAVVCSNDSSITYVATPTGGNYLWDVNGGTILNGQGTDTITVVWGLVLSGTVTLYDTSTTSCPAPPQSLPISISQSPGVLPLIAGNREVCDSTIETYNVFGGSAGSTFTWTVTNGQILGSNIGSSITVQWPDSGSGTVSVVETNASGCNGPVRIEFININDIPAQPILTGDSALCQGSSTAYAVELHPGAGYVWSIIGGTQTGSSFDNDSVFVSWPNAASGQVTVVETNVFGCSSDPVILPVTVSQQPVVDILSGTSSYCQDTSLLLSADAPYGTLVWSTSGSGTFSDTTIASPLYDVGTLDTGRVVLVLTATGAGCPSASDSIEIVVLPIPVIAVTSSADTVCFGTADTLAVNGIAPYGYLWSPGGLTDSSISVAPQQSTTYTVIATTAAGCITTDTITVNVLPPGIPDAGADILACFGDLVSLNGTQTNGTGLQWSTAGDGQFAPADTGNSVTYIPGATDTASRSNYIFLTTTGACLNLIDSMMITYDSLPTVYAGRDTLLTAGFAAGVTIPLQPAVTNAPGVIWSTSGTGFFQPSDTTLNAVYIPSEDDFSLDSIIITLISTGGCQQAGDDFLIDISPFIIPNVFTPYPASPGKNDFFVIRGLPDKSWLRVYDRWGKLVFESTDYRNNWDAANLEAETFYYILVSTGRDFHGWVQVIRED